MSDLFYTPHKDEPWQGPFASVTQLMLAAYKQRAGAAEGVYIASGRPATPEERVYHGQPYTIDGRASFFSWPAWVKEPKPEACGKQCYSKSEAQGAISEAMHRRKGRPRQLRSYYCEPCHAWHLTKQDKLYE